MKGATLVSRNSEFFDVFSKHAQTHGEAYQELRPEEGESFSMRIGDELFLLYGVSPDGVINEYENSADFIPLGYRYFFLIECRSEIVFCEIVASAPDCADFLIIDNSDKLLRPCEISPDRIVL